MTKNSIVWIREDFRCENNEALSYATNNHRAVSAVYIYNSKKFNKLREAQKWWISKSLDYLKGNLDQFNINLEIVSDEELNFFYNIKKSRDISIYWNKIYEPNEILIEKKIIVHFKKNCIFYKNFKGNVLNEYTEVLKNDGTHFKVFTPFWKSAETVFLKKERKKIIKNKKLLKKVNLLKNTISTKDILPKKKWYKKFEKYWIPSEKKGSEIIKSLLKNKIKKYNYYRDLPGIEGTSKLSPYLKHGQVSIEILWDKCQEAKEGGFRKFINELGWREFSYNLINSFPEMLKGNLRKEFDNFPWEKNKKFFDLWKMGMTGYPIVDAGMRELYETGWMHNRIRMVVASFLVKHLRVHWMEGERYFRNCLLDFNEASNIAQWQWVAGCGADAAPYFRIFNPVLQGEKFDKNGLYTKKWVPELKNIPNKLLFKPWEMDENSQRYYNIKLGRDYPFPIVNHKIARDLALNAFKSIKNINFKN
ncbi:MAG: Deoxyribodipyrimidine photo-lyase [Alphaproteobacteria bacterium MarineAlpha5_Bin9]|nr:MAG: Deoxyribodipyrimidine photo-lyase [Alphaproteobacteria bacterium MarineAlpha5_Bin9]|tara:strand:- start:4026 stop:5453 length:1428 start_codon:yes stop_codon:yes gene_type:complete